MNMRVTDIINREKCKFKTYPITGTLSLFLLLLVAYHILTEA